MRNRPIPIALLAVLLAAAVTASVALAGQAVTGADGNSQSIDVKVTPTKLSKSDYTPGALKVSTMLTNSTSPTGVPAPAVHVAFDFDKRVKLFTKGLPTCDPAKIQSASTEVAEQDCGKAKIGSGRAGVLLPISGTVVPVKQVVTAFNGVPEGGHPVILLHAYGTTPSPVTLVLIGKVLNYGKQGYGTRLDVEIPKLLGGTGALTEFEVKIEKRWKYKGDRRSFISATCTKPKTLKARAAFTFLDGEHITATAKHSCKQAK